jgi:hypothetical protein
LLKELQRKGPCKAHLGSQSYSVVAFLKAILKRAHKKGKLREYTSLEEAYNVVDALPGSVHKASVSYGQFLLFYSMFQPGYKWVRIVRYFDPQRDDCISVKLYSLEDRLAHWIAHPECWHALHICGDGFYTFGCHSWQHLISNNSKHQP